MLGAALEIGRGGRIPCLKRCLALYDTFDVNGETAMGRFCLLTASLAFVFCCMAKEGWSAQTEGPVAVVSERPIDNRRPFVAADSDGSRLLVTWDGVADGSRRIFARFSVMGEWLVESIVDNDPLGDNHSPTGGIDGSGNAHLAWLALNGPARHGVMYALQVGNTWALQRVTGEPAPGSCATAGQGDCEELAMRLDGLGRPYLVWLEKVGSEYRIFAARPDDKSGLFRIDDLTDNPSHYNLFPEIHFTPEPSVTWYVASGSEFHLTSRRLDAVTGEWLAAAPQFMEQLPANRLPMLVQGGDGNGLAAFWVDQSENGAADRVLMGLQSAKTRGAPQLIGSSDGASSGHEVSGAAAGGDKGWVAAWVSELPNTGAQVFAGRGVAPPFDAVMASDGNNGYYSQPRASGFQAGAAVVWESPKADGGDGLIRIRRIRF